MKAIMTLLTLAAALVGCQHQHENQSSDADHHYLRDLADDEQDSIQVAKLAEQKAADAHFRTMAHNSIVKDQIQQAQVQSMLANWYGDKAQPRATDEGREMLEKLAALSGTDFDRQYLLAMIHLYGHQLEASRDAANASRPEVKELN